MRQYYWIVFSLFLVVGCQGEQVQGGQKVAEIDSQKTEKGPFDGTYVFDAEAYQRDQKEYKDSFLKEMKAEDVEKMMKIFRPYKVELSGETATASFAYDVIQGKINKGGRSRQGTLFEMVPTDQTKKDQVVKLIIDGDNLILDPGKNPSDRMNFKKVQ